MVFNENIWSLQPTSPSSTALTDGEYLALKNKLLALAAQDKQLRAVFGGVWVWDFREPLYVKYIAAEARLGAATTEKVLSLLQDLKLLRRSSVIRGKFFRTPLFLHFVERAVNDPDLRSFFFIEDEKS